MNRIESFSSNASPWVGKLHIIIWGTLLVLTGTYFRSREANASTIDIIVILRLMMFGLATILGFIMMKKAHWGSGTKVVLVYLTVAGLSVVFSPSHKIAMGYWILLAGASFLTISIVQRTNTVYALRKIENAWLVIMTAILSKDALLSLFLREMDALDAERLGEGITSPAMMGLYASLCFWLTFKGRVTRHPIVLRVLQLILIYIIIASWTRIVITAFILTGVIRLGFSLKQFHGKWILILCICVLIATTGIVAVDMRLEFAGDLLNIFNRGQDAETIKSMAGRIDIWNSSLKIAFEGIVSSFIGYGYGTTRFHLNWKNNSPEFFASHCHSAFLEHLFSMGLLGLASFLGLIAVSARWLLMFQFLRRIFSYEYTLRAATVVLTILLVSITEVPIGGKINPASILFLFYVVSLDKKELFETQYVERRS